MRSRLKHKDKVLLIRGINLVMGLFKNQIHILNPIRVSSIVCVLVCIILFEVINLSGSFRTFILSIVYIFIYWRWNAVIIEELRTCASGASGHDIVSVTEAPWGGHQLKPLTSIYLYSIVRGRLGEANYGSW